MTNPSFVPELCRIFNAKRIGLLCAMLHGQLSIDGYVVRANREHQWTQEQLRGRTARLSFRDGSHREGKMYV